MTSAQHYKMVLIQFRGGYCLISFYLTNQNHYETEFFFRKLTKYYIFGSNSYKTY